MQELLINQLMTIILMLLGFKNVNHPDAFLVLKMLIIQMLLVQVGGARLSPLGGLRVLRQHRWGRYLYSGGPQHS